MPVITGTEGPDQLDSTSQMDEIFALGGADIVTLDDYYANTGAGPEAFHGGDGDDLFVVRALQFTSGQFYYFDATAGQYFITSAAKTGADLVDGTFDGFERYDIQIDSLAARVVIDTANGDDIVDARGNSNAQVTVHTYGGNDILYGTFGNFHLHGGAGDDIYYVNETSSSSVVEAANEGLDTIYYGRSGSGLFSADMADNVERFFIRSGFENNTYSLDANSLDNEIGGGNLNDSINLSDGGADHAFGYNGDDRFFFFFNNSWGAGDVVDGGDGYDLVSIRGNYNTVLTGASLISVEEVFLLETYDYTIVATDTLLAAGASLYVNALGLSFNDVLEFDASAETNGSFVIYSGRGNDILRTGGGNDFIEGAQGVDLMAGGAGNDTYVVDNAADQVIEAISGGADAVIASASYALAEDQEVETLSTRDNASVAAINLIGNEFNQVIVGNAGANILDGLEGIDTMIGLAGNDTYVVDRIEDQVVEAAGQGNDIVFTSVSYVLSSSQEIETLSTQTHAGTENLFLTGNQLNNTLIGNAGNNILNGVEGADTMYGLAGDDIYAIDNAGDLVIDLENQGNDIVYTYLSHTLTNGNQIETLSTVFHQGTDAINLGGSDYDNTLIGNYGANYINGNGGADRMIGLNGDDTYVVDNALDTVEEGAGGGNDVLFSFVSYVLAAGQQVEAISTASQGATTAINMTGNELAQTVVGNAGANVLDGKSGNDTLYGLAGADTFAFTSALGAGNVDTVADFVTGTDKIGLDDAIFTAIGGTLNANAFVIGTAAGDADDRIIYNSATGALLYDADGNGAGAAVQFATLSTGLSLTASDFVMI